MTKTTKSMRLHIGIFGRTNVGKSSFINIITHQQSSIVSGIPGTTTDAVEKTMEMLPLGPVVFIDTAGIDDVSELGEQRINSTFKVIQRTDVAIIICDYHGWNSFERKLADDFISRKIPIISVINKTDISDIDNDKLNEIKNYTNFVIKTSVLEDNKLPTKVHEALIKSVPDDFINSPSILEGIVEPNDIVILVTPIDKEAPKGRLILPQVNVLRELLDKECMAIVVTEKLLPIILRELQHPPKIVITDSQAFKSVVNTIPEKTSLTSFSILFARLKGDLNEFIKGAEQIDNLINGDKILICESCTHHEIADDIARVKIPALIRKKTGKELSFDYVSSHDFPKNIEQYSLIIHCGGCMTNRREILSRIYKSKEAKVPISNYGIVISYCLGILERAIKPFLDLT